MALTVSRRTVLKAIGAVVMAPTIRLRQEVDLERIMLRFCDDQPYRWDLTKPFGIGSLTYATDCRHMVRAEICNRVEDGERKLPKDVEKTWEKHWHPGEFIPFELPPIEALTLGPVRKFHGVCPLCDDRWISCGDTYPDEDTIQKLQDYSYDVDTNSHRDPSCPMCRGKTYYGPCEVEVCGVRMSYSRLKVLATVPNLRVAPNRAGDGTYGPLLFVGDGIEGMSMGLIVE